MKQPFNVKQELAHQENADLYKVDMYIRSLEDKLPPEKQRAKIKLVLKEITD